MRECGAADQIRLELGEVDGPQVEAGEVRGELPGIADQLQERQAGGASSVGNGALERDIQLVADWICQVIDPAISAQVTRQQPYLVSIDLSNCHV